jgi:hypothetical protein
MHYTLYSAVQADANSSTHNGRGLTRACRNRKKVQVDEKELAADLMEREALLMTSRYTTVEQKNAVKRVKLLWWMKGLEAKEQKMQEEEEREMQEEEEREKVAAENAPPCTRV